MIYTLPPLPYAPDALEPKMSRETIDYHYGRHLQTYVDNLNRLTIGTPLEDVPIETLILTATGPVYNNAAQVWNHTFFFNSLTPSPTDIPAELKDALSRDFGSVDVFKEKFKKAAADVFGSGWAWLAQDGKGRLHIIAESNAGNPMRAGYKPLLTIDVWEHAYYVDYRNRRAAYIDNCWELINWNKVAERMHEDTPVALIVDLAEETVLVETDGKAIRKAVEEAAAEDSETADEEADTSDTASSAKAVQKDMRRYVCVLCGYIYDPAEGDPENDIPPGTPFSGLPDSWICPACGVGKEHFEPER